MAHSEWMKLVPYDATTVVTRRSGVARGQARVSVSFFAALWPLVQTVGQDAKCRLVMRMRMKCTMETLVIEEQPVAKRSEASKGAKQSEPEQATSAQDISCQPGVGSAQCWGGLRSAAKAAIRGMPVCN